MTDGLRIFDGAADAASADEVRDGSVDVAPAHARRPRWPGSLAGGLAILMVVTWAIALACSVGGLFELGVGLTLSAMLLSVLAVVAGVVAVIGRWGRGWGIAAVAVGVLLNPVVLLYGLTWIGAL